MGLRLESIGDPGWRRERPLRSPRAGRGLPSEKEVILRGVRFTAARIAQALLPESMICFSDRALGCGLIHGLFAHCAARGDFCDHWGREFRILALRAPATIWRELVDRAPRVGFTPRSIAADSGA